MSFIARLQRAREILEQQGRLSTRALELEIGRDELDDLIEELVDVQQVARREGKILVWAGGSAPPPSGPASTGAGDTAAPTHRAAGQVETRKVISIIFVDLMGSTALQERLDPESVNRVMDAYYEAVRGPVEAAGGTVVQLLGDGVLCAFGIPRIAEDDALRAVRSAVGIQQAFRAFLEGQQWLTVPIGLRVAVNTGEVVVSDEHPAGIGDPLNVAARLQQEARDGEVLIGQATRRLVADAVTLEQAGVFALKGRAESVAAYRVVSLERPKGTTAAFVGRDEELARLSAVYETAFAMPAAKLAVLLGSPGLGKSRLIDEVGRRLGDRARIVAAQCDAAGGATFAPVAGALREWLGAGSSLSDPSDRSGSSDQLRATIEAAIPAGDADSSADGLPQAERVRIAAGITAVLGGSPPPPEETFFVIRRFLTALAKEKPVVLVIDDLQWAEPLLLDLVEHLIQWGSGVPLFVLIGARPELRDLRSSLVTPGGLIADVVTLSGLDAGAAMRLAANVIGAADLPAAIAAKVLATSEGNPLFVGELVRMLVDEGALTREGDRWAAGADLAALEMPPTIHALLASRIERLRPEERTVLERAAVVGRHFSRSAIAALLPGSASNLDAHLEALRRSELIERDTGWLLGEPVLRFHHVLIRDAAYRRLLKGTRAELHAKLADWIETQAGDAAEHDETIGRHLEQAHQFLRELGPIDEVGQRLGERAARRLAAAGRRALARDDLPVASDLLGRAIDRLDADDPARADLALDWCEALLASGDVGPAAAAIEALGRFTADSKRLRAWHSCFAGQHTVLTAPSALHETVGAVATAADELTALGDAAGEAKAHFVHALALSRLGKVGACEAALDRALAAARRAGDRRRANTVLAIAPLAALWGPSPVTRASGRCLDVVRVLRITQGAPAVEAVALSCQGVLEALRGRTEAARRMIASARQMVEELGITQRLLEADVSAGLVALLEGDALAAERYLRGAYDGLRDLGLGIDAARAASLLARTLLAQGRVEEAEALSHESESLAGDDLKAAIAWRGVRAEALAQRGEHAEAIALASRAVEIASATDALLDHADARLALAAALRAAGRHSDADAEERRARDLWQAKGATLLAERAPQPAASVAPPVAAPAPSAAQARRRRPVRANFAIEECRRIEAAVAARDAQALESVYRHDVEIVDHMHGVEYGHDAIVERVGFMIAESSDGAFQHEALATLGDFVALSRLHSTASGSTAYGVPLGATETVYLLVIEADAQGCARRIDIFGEDALTDAMARLYERYAELLPEGAERTRAAGAARANAEMVHGLLDRDRLLNPFAPDVECVDHRVVGFGTLHGDTAVLDAVGAFLDLVTDARWRIDDVLALSPRRLLSRNINLGTDRIGGGAFERVILSLVEFGADGRIARWEIFEPTDEAAALARFDARAAEHDAQRRVCTNAATRSTARFAAALEARDADALPAFFDGALRVVHHPSGSTYGRREMLATWRSALRAERLEFRGQPIASLGDTLVLNRQVTAVEGLRESHLADFGSTEVDEISLIETAADGRWLHVELFAPDRLGEASIRMYERFALQQSEGHARKRLDAIARAVATIGGPVDLERMQAAYAPDLRLADHRVLGTWSGESGAELVGHFRHQLELAPDFAARIDEVLALEPTLLVVRVTYYGTARDSGGAFENRICVLYRFGDDGRFEQIECYEAEDAAAALACFDALTGFAAATEPASHPFDNTASRADREFVRCFNARDWPGVEALAAPQLVFDERRRMLHNRCDRDVWLEQLRVMFDVPASRFTTQLRATRGERLALSLHTFAGEVAGGGGPLAMDDHFVLHEVDRDGRIVAIVLFDLEAEDAARVELDARWLAGDCAEHGRGKGSVGLMGLFAARDWEAVAAQLAPSWRARDHRTLGFGETLRDATTFVRSMQALVELAPDARYRIDHLRQAGGVELVQILLVGTRDGGLFETPFLTLGTVDEHGRGTTLDIYPLDRLDEVRARFAALCAATRPSDPWANAAARELESMVCRFNERDWAGIETAVARWPAFVFDDRRRMMRVALGREDFLAQYRFLFDVPNSRFESTLVATRGERLSLHRIRFSGEVQDGGGPLAFEEHLGLLEFDRDGHAVAEVSFDLADMDAAYAELDARFEAGEAAAFPHVLRSLERTHLIEARDWQGWLAGQAPDFRFHDHRRLGFGDTIRDTGVLLELFQATVALAPDAHYRDDHVRIGSRGILRQRTLAGTRDGEAFESPTLLVVEVDEQGKTASADCYDIDDRDRALARFAELEGPVAASDRFANPATRAFERGSAALAKPNAANAAMDRWQATYDGGYATGDWDAMRALCAAGFTFDDRRRLALLSGDVELMIASARERVAMGARVQRRPIGTAGERVAIEALLWSGGPPGGRFEIEYIGVIEADASGRVAGFVLFDVDDFDAARREAWARLAAIDPERAAVAAPMGELVDAFNAHDRGCWRAQFADQLVVEDHRHAGMGRIEGADAYADSLIALWALAPDTTVEAGWHWPALDRHGAITLVRRTGRIPDGGEFESEYLNLYTVAAGRITHVELYEVEDLDRALARFEALRPPSPSELRRPSADPLRIPPNAATRFLARIHEVRTAGGIEALRALAADDFRFEDRKKQSLVVGGVEEWLRALDFLWNEAGARTARAELLATAGERLALDRCWWREAPGDAAFEIENHRLIEIDADGKLRALVLFDPDDRAAAQAELSERYIASGADGASRAMLEGVRAWNDHDLERLRAVLPDDFYLDDRRRTGVGRIDGAEPYLASLVALWDLSADIRLDILYTAATAPQGRLYVTRWSGTNGEGGDFEAIYVCVGLTRGGQLAGLEIFEIDDFTAARARFEALGANRDDRNDRPWVSGNDDPSGPTTGAV